LNKVYFPYFRLSEDLDFMMATKNSLVDSNRKRQIFAYKMREAIQQITTTLGRTLNPDHLQHKKAQGNKNLKKKEYTYLKYLLTYPSLIDHSSQHIKIELTYTEYIYFPAQQGTIQSLFKDPIFEQPIFPETTIRCYALEEMMSEKMRACLSRRKPAIRDFYDLRYVQQQGLDLLALKPIVQKKLTENEG
jgi:predicted nucleotidyltransferase component of viral defense system